MFRLSLWSITIALVPFIFFFALCDFLSSHPTFAQSIGLLERVAQIGYWVTPSHHRPACARYDARFIYLLRPGRCRFDSVEFDTEISVNSVGLRDDEESLVAPEIIVLGDSHSMGHGVEDQEAYPQVLERSLGRKVLNAGVSSFATARELMLLRLLDKSAARVVVLQYCPNDLAENLSLQRHGTLPILSEREYGMLMQQAQAKSRDRLHSGLNVLQKIGDRMRDLTRPRGGSGSHELQVEAFHNALAGAADFLRGRHVVILEVAGSYRAIDAQFINAARSRLANLGLDLTFVDVSKVLTPQDFFVLDSHMRPSGHEKIAALLAQAIHSREEPEEAMRR